MSLSVYSAQWNASIVAAGSASSTFNIQSVGREIKIRSITLAWYPARQGTNVPIPWRSMVDESIYLQIGGSANKFAAPFDNITGVNPSSNGNYIVMTEPGQLIFDSFWTPNNLPLFLTINNFAAFAIDNFVSVSVEIEQRTMFL